jgi:copper homeostasis protein CutC
MATPNIISIIPTIRPRTSYQNLFAFDEAVIAIIREDVPAAKWKANLIIEAS